MLDIAGLHERAAYPRSREAFARLLIDVPIFDPRPDPVRISFHFDPDWHDAPDDCRHVCYKQDAGAPDPYKRQPRGRFRPDRAARIPWILAALTSPETRIRPSPVREDPGRESYMIWVPADPKLKLDQEAFGVFVRKTDDPRVRAFVTAYTMDPKTADKIKNGGPLIYPAKASKKLK